MTIQKNTFIDQIIIENDGSIFFREKTEIVEGDVVLTSTYSRGSYHPGQDITAADPRVAAVCNFIWTQDVIDKYKEKVEAINSQVSALLN